MLASPRGAGRGAGINLVQALHVDRATGIQDVEAGAQVGLGHRTAAVLIEGFPAPTVIVVNDRDPLEIVEQTHQWAGAFLLFKEDDEAIHGHALR